MTSNNLIAAGKIVGAHGIRGGVKVLSYLETPENFGVYKNFYLKGEKIDLELNFTKNNVAVIDIEGIRKREEVEQLVGIEIFINKDEMPKLKNNEFYYSDLVGLKIIDKKSGNEIGELVKVANFGAGDLAEIKFSDENKKPQFFAFKKEIFVNVNIEKGFAEVNFPEEEFDN